MNNRALKRILALLLGLGLLGGLLAVAIRWRALPEQARVQWAISLTDLRTGSLAQGRSPDELAGDLKRVGVNSLILPDETLSELMSTGLAFGEAEPVRLRVLSGAEWLAQRRLGVGVDAFAQVLPALEPETTYVLVQGNPALSDWLHERLAARLGADRVSGPLQGLDGHQALVVHSSPAAVKHTHLGFWSRDVVYAETLGLTPIYTLTQGSYEPTLAADRLGLFLPPGAGQVLLLGDETAGYPDAAALGHLLKQRGDAVLLDESVDLEGHSGLEVRGLTEVLSSRGFDAIKVYKPYLGERVEDWLLAAKERTMGVFWFPVAQSVNATAAFQSQLGAMRSFRTGLDEAGIGIGAARPIAPLQLPPWVRFLLGAGVAGLGLACWWLFARVVQLRARAVRSGGPALLAVVLGLAGGLAAWIGGAEAVQGLALLAALAGGSAGGLWALLVLEQERPWRGWRQLVRLLMALALPGMISGLLVIGLLARTEFVLELDVFRGVKLALGLPPLLTAVAVILRKGEMLQRVARLRDRITILGKIHVTYGAMLIAVVAIGVGVVLLMRSGNVVAVQAFGPSRFELLMRRVLDNALGARPRFKEVLFGYPLAGLALWLWQERHGTMARLAIVLASLIAPSIINSCAHIHTPLPVVLLRVGNGFWLGGLAAGLVYGLICWIGPWIKGRRDRHRELA